MTQRILVIKLAALGDVVQAFGPFAAIRAHHPGAHIILLTTPPYAALLAGSPWFDAIRDDGRPAWTDFPAVARLAAWLRGQRFDRVYDLQTSGRSSRYRLMTGGAEWSGIARGASHRHANPARDLMHTAERQREQLSMAGIQVFPEPDTSWLTADLTHLDLPPRFVLLVPGASAGRPGKRWPVQNFADLARALPLPVVVIGSKAEAPLARAIGGIDLCGRTSLRELAAIARQATVCIGNDTGPVHLAAAMGTPTVALFGADSDPALCAPRGRSVAVLRRVPISGTTVAEVIAAAGCE
ncbi:glycosyltransferase family 9 protein [Humitalea sp. 24SJ18S-53]|uniref:glycosyltransferase family 9 protein n=1 Tax=Humitalea sp. 24SJ18S-53 TaxID=3422307 RepID=UPI003D67A3C9